MQETGTCDFGEECHFAHSSAELLLESVRDKFVEKSIEVDDTQSQVSIGDSVDVHGARCVLFRRPLSSMPRVHPTHQIVVSVQAMPYLTCCVYAPLQGITA